MSSQAWVDRVLPDIAQSNAEGREIALASSGAVTGGVSAVVGDLSKVASAAGATYGVVRSYTASSQVAAASGLLQACLAARETGALEMASAASGLMKGDARPSAVQEMASAVADFQVGDSAYKLFLKALPALGVQMPPSQWVTQGLYQPSALSSFAQKLAAAAAAALPRTIVIDAITTDPAALSMQGTTQILSPAQSVSVTVVVGDVGQSSDKGVEVSASITPALGAPDQRASTTLDLSAGQAYAVGLSGFRLEPNIPTTLMVTARQTSLGPSTSRSITIEVPGPGFSGTTTSTSLAHATTTSSTSATTTPTTAVPPTSTSTTSGVATTPVGLSTTTSVGVRTSLAPTTTL